MTAGREQKPEPAPGPGTVAVVAHARKSLGGGLPELRRVLAAHGCPDPLWFEVKKSRKAPKRARAALDQGADLIFVWGGDGMVQRCVDALAGEKAAIAVIPAGTANLLATNLGLLPADLTRAVRTGLYGDRRWLDTGKVNGEHFAVMAGAGFDARMIAAASRTMKDRLGRVAYLWTGALAMRARRARAAVEVDGEPFFEGRVSAVLAGNVGRAFGGLTVFPAAEPDDGLLEFGVVTARNPADWARVFARIAAGRPDRSPFVRLTRGHQIKVRFSRPVPYELDGGDRDPVRTLRIRVHPASVQLCVPPAAAESQAGGSPAVPDGSQPA
jgi:diacylglycerol kinase family enzyme